ncbi:hypothetical protein V494_06112 [Pseudogymnoascus sp. VKM F-4513 (FW-928)]|nr:hypothetical protein V494_06112 [Pseudogymnoascus sp. VKM F-4513 (FW-928)]
MPFNPIGGASVRPHDCYRWRSLTDQYSTVQLPPPHSNTSSADHEHDSITITIKDIGSNRAALQSNLLDVKKTSTCSADTPRHPCKPTTQHIAQYNTIQSGSGCLVGSCLGRGGRGGGAGGGVWWERDGDEGAPWDDVASAAEMMRGSPSFLEGCDVTPRVKVTVKVTATETETPQQRRAWRPHERHGNVTVHTRSVSQPVRVNSYDTHSATPIHLPCPALVGVAATLKGMPSD